MRNFLLIAFGFFLAIAVAIAIPAIQMTAHPLGAIKNEGYPLIRVSDSRGNLQCEIQKGESRLLPYGEYMLEIPEIKTTVPLFKNNRGNVILHYIDGKLVVETDANSSVMPLSR